MRSLRDPSLEVIVSARPSVPVRDALVLAAGNGDRFHSGSRQSKLLQPIFGRPLIIRTLESARAAGIRAAEVVLGYQSLSLRDTIEAMAPAGLRVHFSYNRDWHLENGISALAARHAFPDRRFALLMGDHLFEPDVLERCSPPRPIRTSRCSPSIHGRRRPTSRPRRRRSASSAARSSRSART